MARSGDVIDNPVTGERIQFLRTAAETNGELLQMELFVEPGGFVAAEHEHPKQEERFEVLSGNMRCRNQGVERVVSVGESVVVPWGAPHAFEKTPVDGSLGVCMCVCVGAPCNPFRGCWAARTTRA